ncbi:MAG: hypothetical protein JW795_03655 [Chitinivibrionales bacterium]|nr:hypothetical protein [Chitinivibrionales bacterium]
MYKVFHQVAIVAVMMCFTLSAQQAEQSQSSYRVTGGLDFLAVKSFWDVPNPGNLQAFWGRANLGMTYNSPEVIANVNIQAFPEGFGWDPLVTVNFDKADSTIHAKSEPITKFQISAAWAKFLINPNFDISIGRMEKTTSKTQSAGNYIDQDEGVGFGWRSFYHNATEVILKYEPSTTSIMLGAGDKYLNTGYLRILETIKLNEQANMAVGYRSNIFDLIQNSDAELFNRFAIMGDYTLMPGFMPYFEVGILERFKAGSKTEKEFGYPVTFGTMIPGGTILNIFAVEGEYESERDRSMMFNVQAGKFFNKYVLVLASLASDIFGADDGDLCGSLLMIVNLP